MGLFSQVKAAVGVGASQVQVVLEDGRYHWNDTIKGKVIVQGGNVEQRASEVSVNITESWVEVDSDGDREQKSRAYNQRILGSDVPIPVGTTQEWEFELQVPNDGQLGHSWSVAARVSVPGAVDRHGKADFQLLPPRAVMALANLTCQVGECELKSFTNSSSKVTVELKPLPPRQKDLDGLTLIVTDDGRQVAGTFEVNPQEKSMADRLRALAKKDRVRHPIAFDSASLVSATDAPGVSAQVAEQLRSFVAPHLS